MPYSILENDFNWNIMYIKNYSYEYFKINYSDLNCVLENVYICIPDSEKNPEEYSRFESNFVDFKWTLFNRCKSILPKNEYTFKINEVKTRNLSSNNISDNPSLIRINNVQVNDNVITLNYDNIYEEC